MLIFFLPIVFKKILTILLLIRNTRLILTLAIISVTVVNEQMKTPLLIPNKTNRVLSAWTSAIIYFLSALLIFSVSFT